MVSSINIMCVRYVDMLYIFEKWKLLSAVQRGPTTTIFTIGDPDSCRMEQCSHDVCALDNEQCLTLWFSKQP